MDWTSVPGVWRHTVVRFHLRGDGMLTTSCRLQTLPKLLGITFAWPFLLTLGCDCRFSVARWLGFRTTFFYGASNFVFLSGIRAYRKCACGVAVVALRARYRSAVVSQYRRGGDLLVSGCSSTRTLRHARPAMSRRIVFRAVGNRIIIHVVRLVLLWLFA